MRIRIHYTKNEFDDYYDLEEETIEEVQQRNTLEMDKRGLNQKTNNCWSEEMK